jgi:hypothetical protein
MRKGKRYPLELRQRAVRLVLEHREEYPSEWAAILSISQKCGMGHETAQVGAPGRNRSGIKGRRLEL